MHYFFKKTVLAASILTLSGAFSTSARSDDSSVPPVANNFALGTDTPEAKPSDKIVIGGDLNLDFFTTRKSLKSGKDYLGIRLFNFQISEEFSKNIRAVLVTKLEQQILDSGHWNFTTRQKLLDWAKEAYIEIKNVGGKPVAFVFGMQEIAFGLDHHGTLMYHSSPMHSNLADPDHGQVVGLTVTLDQKNIFGYFDKLETTIFETDGSLNIGAVDGLSLRLSKQLTQKISLETSFLAKGNHGLGMPSETRASIGVVYENGDYTVYSEGILLRSGNPQYPHSNFAFTAGISRKFKRGIVTVESTWIQRSVLDITAGITYKLTKELNIGPQVQLQFLNSNGDQPRRTVLIIGTRAQYRF